MTRVIWSSLTGHPWWTVLAVAALFAAFPLLPDVLGWPVRVVLLVLCVALGSGIVVRLRTRPKPFLFGLVALLIGVGFAYGLLELVCWAYLKKNPVAGNPLVMADRHRESIQRMIDEVEGYEVYSPTLGWTIGRNKVSKHGLYRSNADGFRADREYTKEKPPGKIRVLCFGDSYTHGDEVGNQETWEHYAEQAAPDMEFLNFGVPGYGMAQAYLRYTEVSRSFATDYVIIGCMTDDLRRTVNVYYPFRYPNPQDSPNAIAKPYASLDEKGELKVNLPAIASLDEYAAFMKDPLPMLKAMAEEDMLFQTPPPSPFLALMADRWESLDGRLEPAVNYALEAWHGALDSGGPTSLQKREASRSGERKRNIAQICRLLFLRFASDVKKTGAVPVILWYPSPTNLASHNAGKPRDYQSFLDFFAENDIAAVDTLDWLEEIAGKGKPLPVESILLRVHFSAPTNEHIGKRIAAFIRALDAKSSAE
jgi:hypothetical protein